MLPLTNEELKQHHCARVYYIWGNEILKKLSKNIHYRKVKYHIHYTGKYRDAAHSYCQNLICQMKSIQFFRNGKNHDYHFIIK